LNQVYLKIIFYVIYERKFKQVAAQINKFKTKTPIFGGCIKAKSPCLGDGIEPGYLKIFFGKNLSLLP
jgi:hypothetical protein